MSLFPKTRGMNDISCQLQLKAQDDVRNIDYAATMSRVSNKSVPFLKPQRRPFSKGHLGFATRRIMRGNPGGNSQISKIPLKHRISKCGHSAEESILVTVAT